MKAWFEFNLASLRRAGCLWESRAVKSFLTRCFSFYPQPSSTSSPTCVLTLVLDGSSLRKMLDLSNLPLAWVSHSHHSPISKPVNATTAFPSSHPLGGRVVDTTVFRRNECFCSREIPLTLFPDARPRQRKRTIRYFSRRTRRVVFEWMYCVSCILHSVVK